MVAVLLSFVVLVTVLSLVVVWQVLVIRTLARVARDYGATADDVQRVILKAVNQRS